MIQTVPNVTIPSTAAALPALSRQRVDSVAVIAMITRFTMMSGTRPGNVIIGRP